MKQPAIFLAAMILATSVSALEIESYRFTERILSISSPSAPDVFDGAVIFTASAQRRVGISFAHEGYGKVHWFKKLDSPQTAARSKDVLIYIYEYPQGINELKYRLIVDGLWTSDPWNLPSQMDGRTGLSYSVVTLPRSEGKPIASDAEEGKTIFYYETAPGETVTVAGNFNSWDPFMYELKEESPGRYALSLSLPPGRYRYAFFHRGERVLDQRNPRKVYSSDHTIASEIDIGMSVAVK
jgi:hypothetical protein